MIFTNDQIEYILDCVEECTELYKSEWQALENLLRGNIPKPSYSQEINKLILHMASLATALTNAAADIKDIAKRLLGWAERMNMFFVPMIKMTFGEE